MLLAESPGFPTHGFVVLVEEELLLIMGHVGIGLHHQPQRVLVGSHGECSIIDTVNTEGGVRIQSHAIAVLISIGKQLKLNFHHVQPVFRIDSDTHSLKAFRESQISHLAYGVMSLASLMMRFGVVSYGPLRVSSDSSRSSAVVSAQCKGCP